MKVELAVEPGLALPQDVGAVLLDGAASLVLRVMPRRAKKRCRVETDTSTPPSASAARN